MSIFPVNTPRPVNNLFIHGCVIVNGVSLDASYNSTPSTHVLVGSFASGSAGASWLGWAMTDYPVTQQERDATAQRLGRELLASVNSEVLCVGAMEELRRRHREAGAAEDAARKSDRELAAHEGGIQVGLGMALPLLEAVIDRIEPGMTEKAHKPARLRAASEPPMSPGAATSSLIETIQDTVGARGAEVAVMHVTIDTKGGNSDTATVTYTRPTTAWDRIQSAIASLGLKCHMTEVESEEGRSMETMARETLAVEGIEDPSTRILRARLLLDHAKAARDLAHSFPDMLELDAVKLAGLDAAEDIARNAYKNALLDLAAEEDDARDFNSDYG